MADARRAELREGEEEKPQGGHLRWGAFTRLRDLETWVQAWIASKPDVHVSDDADEEALVAEKTLQDPCKGGLGIRCGDGSAASAAADLRLFSARLADAGGRGTCLFHSFLAACVPAARRVRPEARRLELGEAFRVQLAADSAEAAFAHFRATRGRAWDAQDWWDAGERRTIQSAEHYRRVLANPRIDACGGMIQHLAWVFKVNVFVLTVYDGACAFDVESLPIVHATQPCILLLQDAQCGGHFRVVGFPSPSSTLPSYTFTPRSPLGQDMLAYVNCTREASGLPDRVALAGGHEHARGAERPLATLESLHASRRRRRAEWV